jgi:hypothetical protein
MSDEQPKRPSFGEKAADSINRRLASGEPAQPVEPVERVGDLDAFIQYTSFITRGTYLRLLQAVYWEPGFEIKQAVEAGIAAHLDGVPGANKPLPPAQLSQLLKKNKKLKE